MPAPIVGRLTEFDRRSFAGMWCWTASRMWFWPQEVALRGFSAGSFSGLCFLHILWPVPGVVTKGILGAIACPPALVTMSSAEDTLCLVHCESDELCNWRPGRVQLEKCCAEFTTSWMKIPPVRDTLARVTMTMPTGSDWTYLVDASAESTVVPLPGSCGHSQTRWDTAEADLLAQPQVGPWAWDFCWKRNANTCPLGHTMMAKSSCSLERSM